MPDIPNMVGKHEIDSIARAFGMVLRAHRLEAGYSQERLALEAGLQRNYISLLELGHNQPTIGTLFKISKVLGLEPAELIRVTHRTQISSHTI